MAIRTELIKKYCNEAGYEVLAEKDDLIHFKCPKIAGQDMDFDLLAILHDDGKMFEVVSGGFVSTELIQQSDHKSAFLYYLLHFAWNTPFGTPELDKDGELRLLLEMPLEDNTVTFLQFKKITKGLIAMSVKLAIEATTLLKTGKLPSSAAKEETATSGESALVVLMAALADPNVDPEIRKVAAAQANEILASDQIPEQIKLLIRAALGANVPDSI